MRGVKSSEEGIVTINLSTDPRLGGKFKKLLEAEGGIQIDDIIIINKINSEKYSVEVIRKDDERYKVYIELFKPDDRHVVISYNNEKEIEINNKDYTIEELGNELKDFYNNEEYGKARGIHLFGIKYGSLILEKKYSVTEIVKIAEIPDSYRAEVDKGIRLSDYVGLYSKKKTEIVNEKDRVKGGYNKIYYGVPGTGKSYEIKRFLKNKKIQKDNIIRITFHPEYTYNDFVGQLIPVVKEIDGEKEITYDFNKGPFTKAIKRAYENPSEEVYLVIEEMSRGNCAAIFGDIFQLLDRSKDEEIKGKSNYYVNNNLIASQIEKGYIEEDRIYLPSNLFILGTVNTSDQNVFVMDTAFKRRFEWEYISTEPKHDKKTNEELNNEIIYLTVNENGELKQKAIKWWEFYQKLNVFISSSDLLGLGEDKQIGQFFIEFEKDNIKGNTEKIKNKLLHYLWTDIHEVSYIEEIRLFDDSVINFSNLYDKYKKNEKIFSDSFLKSLNFLDENSAQ
ncbi:MAG: AAA family ATPase [Clostridia bacterium]|nr:AAA family ATPase [Clostridia bacterium]